MNPSNKRADTKKGEKVPDPDLFSLFQICPEGAAFDKKRRGERDGPDHAYIRPIPVQRGLQNTNGYQRPSGAVSVTCRPSMEINPSSRIFFSSRIMALRSVLM